jgi:hypothetical protein
MFGLFWVDAGCMYRPADFNTFAEAQKYIARAEHNHNIKPIIHNK